MKNKELFAFCQRQVFLIRFLEKIKLFTIKDIGAGIHPITNALMCQIFYVKMRSWLYSPIQHLIDLIVDQDGKARIKELERIGYLKRHSPKQESTNQ